MSSVALVTGGGRGIGRAFALALSKQGWRVAAASRTQAELTETLRLLNAGADAIAIQADVTGQRAVESMVATVEEKLGPVDLLVNNAGAGPPFGPLWESGADEWWRNIEVNLKGPMLCSRAVLPGMIERRRGTIINVASGAGTVSIPYLSAYVTAKTALIRLTELLADELRPHGVCVFAIEPGAVRTAMAEQLLQSEEGKRWLPWFQRIFDEGRDVTTQPAEELLLHLASGKAAELSGRFFTVKADGPVPLSEPGVLRLVSIDSGARRER
jgi:NAD(P)-dependent dehydrogenase (short-subunit alcohol dehydrogenase family)